MPVHFAHRIQKRIVTLAVLGIVGWLFAFAGHLHTVEQDEGAAGSHAHHACVLCAALQPGAGAPAQLVFASAQPAPRIEPFVLLPSLAQQVQSSYQSRAPPRG